MKFEIRSAAFPLIAVTVAVFILQFVLGDWFSESFLLSSADIFTRPWILITHIFLHGSPLHLFYNMWGLFMFGTLLESRIGAKRFLAFYISAGVIAGYISSFFYSSSLGASGALMGVIGALIILMPNLKLLLFYVVPTPLWLGGIIFAALDTFGVFFPSGVGNIAHLAGMGFGLLYGLYLIRQKTKFDKKFSVKKKLNSVDVDEYLKSGRI
ncbi:MAG TPA: rhomboid family intramembrane serine protease [Candidatus Nanoarchaeia archaeon]|nr:rhomboid family intramembrane serine protease [Candidatus Nanoarchaeia archaeon]